MLTKLIQSNLKDKLLKTLEKIEFGSITLIFCDDKKYHFQGNNNGVQAELVIYDNRSIYAFSTKGDVGLAESYKNGWIDTPNLENLLTLALQNANVLQSYIYGGLVAQITSKILYAFRMNTLKGSKKNIHSHYDLGNDFYSLWLDETMSYSAAIFDSPSQSLAGAQNQKYDRIIDTLEKNSGDLLEIGCGWGGFINRALSKKDYQIKALTISDNQYNYATNRLKKNKISQAQVLKQDYRLQQGKFNSIVSIEMFEAVGQKYWATYFNKIKSLLKTEGKAVIQTIHIDNNQFENYQKTGDMIRTFIFPGGMLPSKKIFELEANKAGLIISDEYSFGKDYATTLSLWLKRFESALPEIKQLNFDDAFIKIWRFYLVFCMVGFKQNRTNVSQFRLEHA